MKNQKKSTVIIREAAVAYQPSASMQMATLARKGVSKKELEEIAGWGGISINKISTLLPVTLRTVQRYKGSDRFDTAVSEHILSIAEVFTKAEQVLGSPEKLHIWLFTPLRAAGNDTPFSLLDTGFGARYLLDELGRLEHGVYS